MKNIIICILAALCLIGISASAFAADPDPNVTPDSTISAQSQTDGGDGTIPCPSGGCDFPINHSCTQVGPDAGNRGVACADLSEYFPSSTSGVYFRLKMELICARGATVVACTGAKGLDQLYVSGYGWSAAHRFSCGGYGGPACSASRNYDVNPTLDQEHPTPSCRTLASYLSNITFRVGGQTLTIDAWRGTNVQFCV